MELWGSSAALVLVRLGPLVPGFLNGKARDVLAQVEEHHTCRISSCSMISVFVTSAFSSFCWDGQSWAETTDPFELVLRRGKGWGSMDVTQLEKEQRGGEAVIWCCWCLFPHPPSLLIHRAACTVSSICFPCWSPSACGPTWTPMQYCWSA